MTTSDPKPQLPPIFTPRQQALIEHIFSTKIFELIASGGLVCSHCSSSRQLPWLLADSKVTVPTTQLQQPATTLQQFIDSRSDIEAKTSSPSTNSVAANLSTSAILCDKLASVDKRLIALECRFKKFESSMVQSSSLNPENKNTDSTRLLKEMHAKFEITMSKLQSALKQTVYNQLESTDCDNPAVLQCRSDSSSNVVLEQSDINSMKALHSVAVDIHEVLDTLVLNIGHEHNELAEFVQQLSQCTASADDVIELKAVVECMARVTGVSEHKAEQLITDFIGKEGVELERLKREQRLADDKIRELLLARDQIAEMYDSPYQNQLPYLNCVAETMRSECSKYKRDLNAISKKLSERVNAKVAQAIQQSLVDKHQQNNKAQFGLPSTEGQDTKPGASVLTRFNGQISAEMPQPVVDNGGTVTEAAAAALEDETNFKRYQDIQTELKDAAISGPPPLPAKLGSKYTRVQWQDQLSNSNKPLDVTVKSVLRSKSPFEQLAEPLSMQQQTTTTTQQQEPSVATSSSGKISTEMLQLVADDVSTVLAAAAPTAALQDETEPKRHQDTHTQVKDTAISSRSSIARMPIETDSNDTRSQPEDQLPKLNKPLDVAVTSVSRSESPSEQVAEPLCRQQLTTTQQQEQYGIDDAMPQQSIWPIIKCVVVGHESAQAYKLIRAYFDKRMGSSVTLTPDGISVDEHVPVKNGTFNCKLCLSKCSEAKQLKHIVCDIIVICFSVIDEVSYQEVRKVWVKQIKQEFPEIPYWLVGTQADQRQTTGVRHFQVEYEQGLQLCRKIGAVAYFECSELDDVGAEAMFNCAVQHVVHKLKYFSRPSIK